MTSYRANAIPTCGCGARLRDAPLLSPATGAPVCGACHARDLRDGPEADPLHIDALRATFVCAFQAMTAYAIAWLLWFMSGTTNDVLAAFFVLLGTGIVARRVVRVGNRSLAPKRLTAKK